MKEVATDRKVVLFGELMMRLSTKRHERIVRARELDVLYRGAEASEAAMLLGASRNLPRRALVSEWLDGSFPILDDGIEFPFLERGVTTAATWPVAI